MGLENNHSLHNPPYVANISIVLTSMPLLFLGSNLNEYPFYGRFSNALHVGKLNFTMLFSIPTGALLTPF
jgi:hypothetical protein